MNAKIKELPITVDQINKEHFGGARQIPADLELERSILGAILWSYKVLIHLRILNSDCFYFPQHLPIWQAICEMEAKAAAIDLVTITEQLRKNGDLEFIGGPAYLSALTNKAATSATAPDIALFLRELATRRKIIETSGQAIYRAFDRTFDALQAADLFERDAMALNSFNIGKVASMADIAVQINKDADLLAQKTGNLTGIPTGIDGLDEAIDGLQAPDMFTLAARPGMGKTGLALSIAKYVSERGIPVGLVNLEMSNKQVFNRIASMEAEIQAKYIRNPSLRNKAGERILSDLALERRAAAIAHCSELPIRMEDEGGMNIAKLRSVARKMKSEHGIQVLILDYLQLMEGGDSRGSRENDVSKMSRGFKTLLKELDIAGICLSQLSRAVETRGGSKIPKLSDLRESGSIEQDSDIVAFIYRPEYYDILEDEAGESLKGLAKLIIAKNRHGELDTIDITFDAEFTRFRNYTYEWEETATDPAPVVHMVPPQPIPDDEDELPF